MLLIALGAVAVDAGLRVQRAAWDFSSGAHFRGDVNNAIYWGRQSANVGLFHVYDAVARGETEDPNRKIDYPPLRLAMASAWWRWVHRHYPAAIEWQDDYAFAA